MKLVASAGQSLLPGNVIMLFIKDQGYKLKVPLPLFSWNTMNPFWEASNATLMMAVNFLRTKNKNTGV